MIDLDQLLALKSFQLCLMRIFLIDFSVLFESLLKIQNAKESFPDHSSHNILEIYCASV